MIAAWSHQIRSYFNDHFECLVVTGTMEFYIILWHFYINWEQMGIILPSDELILFRGVGIPPTRCALFNLGAIILQVVISLEAKWSQGWPLKMATTLMAAGHWFLSRRLFVLLRFQSTNLVNRYIYIYMRIRMIHTRHPSFYFNLPDKTSTSTSLHPAVQSWR